MRALICALVACLGSASAAFAQVTPHTPYEVCDNLSYDSDKVTCIGIVNGKRFDQLATGVCYILDYDSSKVSCMREIANREYDQQAVEVCSRLNYDSDMVSCLKNAGRAIRYPDCPSVSAIKGDVDAAIDDIDRRDIRRAKATLEDLSDRLRDCQN